MKVLFIGDVVGVNGCNFLASKIYSIKKQYNVDYTIVNGENSAKGNGINRQSANMLFSLGADVITTGNHAFHKRDGLEVFENDRILRPANYPNGCIGKGFCTVDCGMYSFAVINLLGTVFLEPLDNPFTVVDNLLSQIKTPNIIVDIHAEATSEKRALGLYLAGKVSAVLGTHTHVQTADECILSEHTGYITDVGMCGAVDSVLGINKEEAINRFRFRMPTRFTESENSSSVNAVVLDIDTKYGKCSKIERIFVV